MSESMPEGDTDERKQRIRLGAALYACTQGEFLDPEVAEYIEARAAEIPFEERVEEARRAYALGEEASVAYLRGDEYPGL